MDGNILGTLLVFVTVLIFLGTGEFLARKQKISKENARKFVHISVGNIIIFVPIFNDKLIATAVPLAGGFGNFLFSPKSPFEKMKLKTFDAGHAMGTVYYAVALTALTYLGFDTPWIIAATFLPVAYGDGFAAVMGPKAKSGKFRTIAGEKTLLGTSSMLLASFLSVSTMITLMGYDLKFAILIGLIAATVGSIIELISLKGLDNLLIPLGLFPILWYFLNSHRLPSIFVIVEMLVSLTDTLAYSNGFLVSPLNTRPLISI